MKLTVALALRLRWMLDIDTRERFVRRVGADGSWLVETDISRVDDALEGEVKVQLQSVHRLRAVRHIFLHIILRQRIQSVRESGEEFGVGNRREEEYGRSQSLYLAVLFSLFLFLLFFFCRSVRWLPHLHIDLVHIMRDSRVVVKDRHRLWTVEIVPVGPEIHSSTELLAIEDPVRERINGHTALGVALAEGEAGTPVRLEKRKRSLQAAGPYHPDEPLTDSVHGHRNLRERERQSKKKEREKSERGRDRET